MNLITQLNHQDTHPKSWGTGERLGSSGTVLISWGNQLQSTMSDRFADLLPSPPKTWVEARDDTSSIATIDTFHTAIPASPPNTYLHRGLRRTDTVPPLTPTRHEVARSRRRKATLDHEALLRDSNVRQDFKLRLAQAKEQVRVLQSLDPNISTSRFSLPSLRSKISSSYKGREIDNQKNPIPALLRSGLFWFSLLLFLMGVSSTSAAVGVMCTRKSEGQEIAKGIIFWLVCSTVAVVIGAAAAVLVVMRMGRMGLGFLKKVGFYEVQNFVDGDLEKGVNAGGMFYLGVGERDVSTLGGSRADITPRNRWQLKNRASQDDDTNLGAQRLRPTQPTGVFEKLERYVPPRDEAVGRKGFRGDEEFEMDNLGGDGKKFRCV